MPYTSEQITKLENPYKELGTADALAANRVELNKLAPKEMKDLAQRIILGCLPEKMNDLRLAINVLQSPQGEFYTLLSEAHEVKKRILAYSIHPAPYTLFIGNNDLFNKFTELALKLVENRALEIAIRLALTTPENQHHALSQTLQVVLPNSALTAKTMEAFLVQRGAAQLTKEPLKFFLSREFFSKQGVNVQLVCKEYVELFKAHLKDHEQTIGETLAHLNPEQRLDISNKLKEIEAKLGNDNPFRTIAVVMASREPQNLRIVEAPKATTPETAMSQAFNPYGFHAKSGAASKSAQSVADLGIIDGELSDSDNEEESWFAACFRKVTSI